MSPPDVRAFQRALYLQAAETLLLRCACAWLGVTAPNPDRFRKLRPADAIVVGQVASAGVQIVQGRNDAEVPEGRVLAWTENEVTLCLAMLVDGGDAVVAKVDPSGASRIEGPTQRLTFEVP